MIDANYFKENLSKAQYDFKAQVDEWLEKEVLPKFRQNAGYEVPIWTETRKLEKEVKERGFLVTSYRGYQGCYVYIGLEDEIND